MWAPAVVAKDGRYYLFFAANDIQSDRETGGIGVAVANRPDGPFRDLLGKPLVGAFHNGAQPIDQSVFRDDDLTKDKISLNAEYGVVYLRGEVPSKEVMDELTTRTRAVDGVRAVENLTHLPGEPARTA